MLQRRTASEDPRRRRFDARRDRGVTFVELLVAIVLLGTVGVGVLAALRVSVDATRLERDHSRAYQWLQSANGVLQATPRVSCGYTLPDDGAYASGEEKVRLEYQEAIRSTVENPPGWDESQLSVVEPVKVWDGSRYWDPTIAPQPCYDSDGYLLQLITLQVTSPDGDIIETLEVVKRD